MKTSRSSRKEIQFVEGEPRKEKIKGLKVAVSLLSRDLPYFLNLKFNISRIHF